MMDKSKLKDGDRFRVVVYRDLKQDGYDNQYELVSQAGDMIVKEQILLGQFGMPDMYIRHLSLTLTRGGGIPIISYTDYELTPLKGLEIMANAVKLLNSDE